MASNAKTTPLLSLLVASLGPDPSTEMAPTSAPPLLRQILAVDAAVSRAIHTATKPLLPPSLLLLLEISADFRFSFPVSLSLLLSPSLRPFLSPFLLGLLVDLLLVGLVKLVFRRSRPAYNHPSMSAAVTADHFSFPSGHASRVFFVAAFVHVFSSATADPAIGVNYSFLERWIRYRDGDVKGAVLVVVWAWAAVTAISRVFLGRHFVLDVAAGACLGILEAFLAFRFLRLEMFARATNVHLLKEDPTAPKRSSNNRRERKRSK